MDFLTRGVKALSQMIFPRAATRWASLPRTTFNYQAAVGDGSRSSIVMACINWMARTFPEAPVMVERVNADATREQVVGHPLTLLLARPNLFYSGFNLWMGTLSSWNMDGNAYWLKVKSNNGRTLELRSEEHTSELQSR